MSQKGGGIRAKPAAFLAKPGAFWEKPGAFCQGVGSGVGSRLQRLAESAFLPIIPATFAIIVAIRTFYLTLPTLPTPKTSSSGVGSVGSVGCFLRFTISMADAQSPIGFVERRLCCLTLKVIILLVINLLVTILFRTFAAEEQLLSIWQQRILSSLARLPKELFLPIGRKMPSAFQPTSRMVSIPSSFPLADGERLLL